VTTGVVLHSAMGLDISEVELKKMFQESDRDQVGTLLATTN
jgi:hypothetical protein